jgi:hypothetical protein
MTIVTLECPECIAAEEMLDQIIEAARTQLKRIIGVKNG